MNWQAVADACAKEAHEQCFEKHWGLWSFEDVEAICVFSNHPYEGSALMRHHEWHQLKGRLADNGHSVLAEASYPKSGEEAGYTVALVVAGSESDVDGIAMTYQNILRQSSSLMVKKHKRATK
jgi:hypothetical protein